MPHKVFIRHTYIYKCADNACSEEWKINEADKLEKLIYKQMKELNYL